MVHSIDVVLSQDLAEQLYVLQYPLRPQWRGYDSSMLDSVRFKSGQQILEMEYKMKEEEKQKEQATKILSAVTGAEFEDPTREMQSYLVRSTVVPNKSNYLVGLYRDHELHVTPLKGVLQMRPSFAYIDQSNEAKRKKKEAEALAQAGITTDKSAAGIRASMDDMGAAETDALKPAQFQIKKKESEKATQNRLRSYAYLKQLEAEEEFVKLDFVIRERQDAMAMFERLRLARSPNLREMAVTKATYLATINPPLADDGTPIPLPPLTADAAGAGLTQTIYAQAEIEEFKKRRVVFNQVPPVLSMHTVQQQPENERVAALLNNANCVTWSMAKYYTRIEDEAVLIKHLKNHAVLLHGVWVVKTEKSYRHRAANVRNWVLSKIANAIAEDDSADSWWYLSRQRVATYCGISLDMARTILDPITSLVPGKGLQLLYAPSDEMEIAGPGEVRKFNNFWASSGAGLEGDMMRWRTGPPKPAGAPAEEEETTRRAVGAAANLLRPASHSSSSSSTPAPGAMERATVDIDQALESNYMGNFGQITLSAPAQAQMDKFLTSALMLYGVVSVKGLLKLAAHDPASLSEIDPITEDIMLQELGRHSIKIREAYVGKPGADPSVDKFRDVVVTLFKEKDSLTRQEVNAAFRTTIGKEPSRVISNKIIDELVVVKANSWVLKTGDCSGDEMRKA